MIKHCNPRKNLKIFLVSFSQKMFQSYYSKTLSETTHPLTIKLSLNLRATSINKKYIAPRASTEAYSNTFLQKYLRHLRDGCTNLYLPRSIKNYNTIINNNCSQLIKPITTRIISIKGIQQSEQIACPQCNQLFKTSK